MTHDPVGVASSVAKLPPWARAARPALTAGVALALFDQALRAPPEALPAALLRDRMAMAAALATGRLQGRRDTAADLRDAICLTHAGDALGPGGEILDLWSRAARIRLDLSGAAMRLARLLPVPEGLGPLPGRGGCPLRVAAGVLAADLMAFPDQESVALVRADAALAGVCGWSGMVPLIGAHLTRRDLQAIAEDSTVAEEKVQRAVTDGCTAGLQLAATLTRRAAHLRAVAPKLRMKGSDAAVDLFLQHDALSPRLLRDRLTLTDRAARRFCDRLVTLEAVREVTGRATSRLYGL